MLTVDPQILRNVANNVRSRNSDFTNQKNKIVNISEQLRQVWVGDDANKYFTASTEQINYLNQLITTINEVASFLDSVASRYEQAKIDNANAIRF